MMPFTTTFLTAACTANAFAQVQEIPPGLFQNPIDPDLVATVRAALPESRAIGAEFLDPDYEPFVRLNEAASVTVTFIDEGAGFRNSLAWVAWPTGTFDGLTKADVDLNGNSIVSLQDLAGLPGVEFGLVFPNASRLNSGGLLQTGDAITLGDGRDFDAGTTIGFCLLQNAWKGGNVNGYTTALETTLSMHSLDMLNPESPSGATLLVDSTAYKSRHVAMLFSDASQEQVIMGFEDLHRLINSDEDFNDAVFVVSSTPAYAISGADIPTADPAFNPRPQDLYENPDSCSIDTTDILSNELPERTNVNAEFMNPDYVPTLVVSDPTQLAITFVGEGAIYQNSLGYIAYEAGILDNVSASQADADLDGIVEPWELRLINGVEVGMVFAHASEAGKAGALVPGEALILADRQFEAGTHVDFFLVQDGWNDDRTVKDFMSDTAESTLTFYTIDRFNPEPQTGSQRHVAMMFSDDSRQSVLFGFEDLHRTDRVLNPDLYESDEDFNDNVFCVAPLTFDAISTTNITTAGRGCPADLNNDGVSDLADLLIALQRSSRPVSAKSLGGTQAGEAPFSLHDYLAAFAEPCR